MTIREIEEKTGMTRANVRYYEREGLLSPVRGANNYRDYSEDDLAALKKIQLLWQLRVPVAEIVRLKNGEVSLDTVLASQSWNGKHVSWTGRRGCAGRYGKPIRPMTGWTPKHG